MYQNDDWHWTTKENKTIHIRDMETQHLKNCIRIIKNNNYGYTEYFGADEHFDETYHCYRNKYENMINELRLRKLEIQLNELNGVK